MAMREGAGRREGLLCLGPGFRAEVHGRDDGASVRWGRTPGKVDGEGGDGGAARGRELDREGDGGRLDGFGDPQRWKTIHVLGLDVDKRGQHLHPHYAIFFFEFTCHSR